jgi:hypothetical protein
MIVQVDLRDSGTQGKTTSRIVAGIKVTASADLHPALEVVYEIPYIKPAYTAPTKLA